MHTKITVPKILAKKGKEKIKMTTAYDTPSALIAGKAGADIILVGDSVATTVLGFDNTLHATLDMMVYHTSAVARAKPDSLIVADMPWLSYHISPEETIKNAGRLIREGQAQAVKIEGGSNRIPVIKSLLSAEIPVMGHLGLTPQSFHTMGGYHVQGKDPAQSENLLNNAQKLADAGIFALVLEGIPGELAKTITEQITIPTLGIGAGPHCDGQVLVFHDVLGLIDQPVPKFVRKYADLSEIAVKALINFFRDIDSGSFPSENETYQTNSTPKKTKSK